MKMTVGGNMSHTKPISLENAWYIVESKTSTTTYICSCGKQQTVDTTDDFYQCTHCDNMDFISYENFLDTSKHFFSDLLNLNIDITSQEQIEWSATVSYILPKIDNKHMEVTLHKNSVYNLTLTYSGTQNEQILDPHIEKKSVLSGVTASKLIGHIRKETLKALTQYIFTHKPKTLFRN